MPGERRPVYRLTIFKLVYTVQQRNHIGTALVLA